MTEQSNIEDTRIFRYPREDAGYSPNSHRPMIRVIGPRRRNEEIKENENKQDENENKQDEKENKQENGDEEVQGGIMSRMAFNQQQRQERRNNQNKVLNHFLYLVIVLSS